MLERALMLSGIVLGLVLVASTLGDRISGLLEGARCATQTCVIVEEPDGLDLGK